MTPKQYDALTGAEKLRRAVLALGSCRESFLEQYSATQLLAIHRAWALSDWDYPPDVWERKQVRQALRGVVPQWDEDGEPVYERQEVADERSNEPLPGQFKE